MTARHAPFVLAGAALALGACASAVGGAVDGGAGTLDAGPPGPVFGGATEGGDPADASLASRVQGLFASCAGLETSCHGTGTGGVRFRLEHDGGDVFNVPSFERPDMLRVRPYDPAHSYVFLKVAHDGGIDGSPMPPGAPFDPAIPALVAEWINAGAPSPDGR